MTKSDIETQGGASSHAGGEGRNLLQTQPGGSPCARGERITAEIRSDHFSDRTSLDRWAIHIR